MTLAIDLTGQTAFITGAANGIGAQLVKAFLQAGANVAGFDIQTPTAQNNFTHYAQQRQQSLTYTQVDTSVRADIQDALLQQISALGGVDILVNNVGVSIVKPFLEVTEEEWARLFAINVNSTFYCCQGVIPTMQQQQRGCIINIASELAYLGRAEFVPYTASKGAIVSMTRSLAQEFAPNIRINGIAPGPCDTDMLRKELQTPEQLEKELALPLGRFAQPQEIAASAVFLASDLAGYYCGDILSPNGGSLMR